ncbi:tetratricopeptide repeat protein [candidate division GN15 bacterium]|nr:tetratricopeptide repeat protein [candidate division GN15 bacterium]
MSAIFNRFRRARMLALVLISSVAVGSAALAAGSSEKSSEEKADEQRQDALEHYNEGVEHMERAREIAAQDDSAFAYNYRATVDAKAEKEYEKAVERFRKAIDKDPEMIEAHNNLGYSLRKLGRLEASLEAYNRALEIDSTFAQAREYRGETYLAMGELEKAQRDHQYLRSIESPYADTLQMSIDLYQLQEIDARMRSGEGGDAQ